ncbi:MAG: transcription elongation factor GreA, partial [Aeromicrobium sp.]|nr:transcription elongation factor GreA [Aeromicrobium sp.]MCW2790020.1 transcription elongation factor GreA [Aeromicrobium sp.]
MTQPTETDTIWVTQEAYDRLQQELQHLKGDV